jgi:hypothetical protein
MLRDREAEQIGQCKPAGFPRRRLFCVETSEPSVKSPAVQGPVRNVERSANIFGREGWFSLTALTQLAISD